jgi:tetratricopeptide (TPR) repeat protein
MRRGFRGSFLPLIGLLSFLPLQHVAAQQDKPDALLMYRNGQYNQAVQTTLNEINQMPKNMDSYAVLGWSLLKLGRYQDAVTYATKALSISRYDNRIVEILGEAYFFLGSYPDSMKYLQEYTVLAPSGDRIDDVYFFMGEIYLRNGEYDHADIAFSTAVYYTPNVAQWWARLGYAREMAKHYNLSLDAYNHALQLNADLADAVQGRARVLQEQATQQSQ